MLTETYSLSPLSKPVLQDRYRCRLATIYRRLITETDLMDLLFAAPSCLGMHENELPFLLQKNFRN